LVFRHLEREWQLPLGRLPFERGRLVRTTRFSQGEPVVLVFRHLEREWQLPLGRLPLERER